MLRIRCRFFCRLTSLTSELLLIRNRSVQNKIHIRRGYTEPTLTSTFRLVQNLIESARSCLLFAVDISRRLGKERSTVRLLISAILFTIASRYLDS